MRKREVAIQMSEHEYDTSIEYSVDPTSETELEALYGRLSAGGKPATPSGYKGSMVELPDNTTVGLRVWSKSGGKAIDINMRGTQLTVHIE